MFRTINVYEFDSLIYIHDKKLLMYVSDLEYLYYNSYLYKKRCSSAVTFDKIYKSS